jgi:NodT family efflux transporter outer membrane factor (OMF) lipoprotein
MRLGILHGPSFNVLSGLEKSLQYYKRGINMSKKIAVLGLLGISLSGCITVGPDYKKPKESIKKDAEWSKVTNENFSSAQPLAESWWKIFNDPLLDELIETAKKNNYDLKIAIANVAEARARLGIARGDGGLMVGADGAVGRVGEPENDFTNKSTIYNDYGVGMDASWEIDVFGRIRRQVESSTAEYIATAEDRNNVMISLYAQVATTYFEIRSLQASLKAIRSNVKAQEKIYRLTKDKFDNGITNKLDVAQASLVLANTRASIPSIEIQLDKALNTITVLLGEQPPGQFRKQLEEVIDIPLVPGNVAVGVPFDILRQRPDVRRAEKLLAAQVAKIGVAEAEIYPSFSLNGNISYSTDAHALFSSDTRGFSFGPAVRWNILQGGKIKSQIAVEDAKSLQALYRYEKTVLRAMTEVEDAMTSFILQRIEMEAQRSAYAAAKESLDLSLELYSQGLTDFQNVQQSQTQFLEVDQSLAASKGESAKNLVRVYKSIGGGWNPNNPMKDTLDVKKERTEKIDTLSE